MRITILALAVAFAPVSMAGTIYKCVDAKGNSTYKETPREKDKSGGAIGYAEHVAATPQLSWTAQTPTLVRQNQQQYSSPRTYSTIPTKPWESRVQTSASTSTRRK